MFIQRYVISGDPGRQSPQVPSRDEWWSLMPRASEVYLVGYQAQPL
ncbi:MAG TPA: hypothetical protein VME46_04985 [Acidimicrobiales bacterium]|nr:hypothetical protein [Acidimicrobiales bacterium]